MDRRAFERGRQRAGAAYLLAGYRCRDSRKLLRLAGDLIARSRRLRLRLIGPAEVSDPGRLPSLTDHLDSPVPPVSNLPSGSP